MSDPGTVAAKLRLVVRLLDRRAQADAEPEGPSRSQQAVLAWLDERGPLTPGALAGLEHVRQQSMTPVVDAAVRRGWVVRAADPGDRRRVVVALTEAGRAALERGRELRQAWFVDAIAALTPEEQSTVAHAVDLLEAVVRR